MLFKEVQCNLMFLLYLRIIISQYISFQINHNIFHHVISWHDVRSIIFMTFLFLFFLVILIQLSNGRIRINKDYECNCTGNHNCEPYYESSKKCNFIIKPKKVINIYEDLMKNYVKMNPLSSTCLKCAICVAVSSEVDKNMLIISN